MQIQIFARLIVRVPKYPRSRDFTLYEWERKQAARIDFIVYPTSVDPNDQFNVDCIIFDKFSILIHNVRENIILEIIKNVKGSNLL